MPAAIPCSAPPSSCTRKSPTSAPTPPTPKKPAYDSSLLLFTQNLRRIPLCYVISVPTHFWRGQPFTAYPQDELSPPPKPRPRNPPRPPPHAPPHPHPTPPHPPTPPPPPTTHPAPLPSHPPAP